MPERWAALAVLTTARVTLGLQFQSLASVALPLSRDFALGYADLGFLIGLYMLPGIVLAIPGGLLGQRFGDKRVVCVGLVLMVAGSALAATADSHAALIGGRLLSGIGGVLLNVVMSKMVADWFVGREIILAMAIFINAFPIGVGLALLLLGPLAEALGWRSALGATSVVALAALLLVAAIYHRHANDRRPGAAALVRGAISRAEVVLVCIAGAIWGIFNGAHAILVGFMPILLVRSDFTVAGAGLLVAAMSWLGVVTIVAGGAIAQRWGHVNTLLVVSMSLSAAGLLALPSLDPAAPLLAVGLVMGLPIGIITALPAAVLRPESRGAGLGLFYTCLYVGHAGLPPLAGWLQDLTGARGAAAYCAGALFLAIVPLFGAFRVLQRQLPRLQPATS